MSRRVHFHEDPVDGYRTPSPIFSESDETESLGPSTPPQQPYMHLYNHPTPPASSFHQQLPQSFNTPSPHSVHLSPAQLYPHAHLPVNGPAQLHKALTAPHLLFDVALPPNNQGLRLPNSILAEPATFPPLPCMILQCASLPWNINVQPSPAIHSPATGGSPYGSMAFVTVGNVLDAMYTSLRTAVKAAEYDRLQSDMRSTVARTFEARIRDSSKERQKGVKRVDLLAGRTRVEGFTPGSKDEVWMFHVRP